MIKCDIREATHVLHHGTLYRIKSKWGVDQEGRLAKPSEGGFGCVTDTGERIGMMEAESYFREEIQEKPFMSVWTIYFNPRDFPGKYVARRWDIVHASEEPQPSREHFVADSLNEIRSKLPLGLACLTRSDGDEPQILETWL